MYLVKYHDKLKIVGEKSGGWNMLTYHGYPHHDRLEKSDLDEFDAIPLLADSEGRKCHLPNLVRDKIIKTLISYVEASGYCGIFDRNDDALECHVIFTKEYCYIPLNERFFQNSYLQIEVESNDILYTSMTNTIGEEVVNYNFTNWEEYVNDSNWGSMDSKITSPTPKKKVGKKKESESSNVKSLINALSVSALGVALGYVINKKRG